MVVEGIDGSGKTTQHRLLANYLECHYEKLGFNGVVAVREPGGTAAGEEIRNILLNLKLDPVSQALMFLAARSQLMQEVVIPALNQNKIVVSDRFELSTWVYQFSQISNAILDYSSKITLARAASRIQPNLTIVLEVSPTTAMSRLAERGNTNVMDGSMTEIALRSELYKGTYGTYQDKLVRLSAEEDILDVHHKIVDEVKTSIVYRGV